VLLQLDLERSQLMVVELREETVNFGGMFLAFRHVTCAKTSACRYIITLLTNAT